MSEQIEKQLDCDEFSFAEPTPTELLHEMALDSSRIVDACPLASIAAAASLFYQPSLQSNTLRIEATVHLVSSLANGHVTDCQGLIVDVFDALGGTSLRVLEDPCECLMSAPVVFGNESHLLLNGIWEHNTFILQRVLDVVSTMPSSGGFEELKECVFSFLRVANACCRRSGLTRYEIGADSPADQINSVDLIHPEYTSFSLDDLADWGVNPKWLKSFIVCNDALKSQQEYPVSRSLLHRFPIVQRGDDFVLALPCSVPIAIREFLIEMAIGNDLVNEFGAALKDCVKRLLLSERVFGLPPNYPLRFSKTPEGWITEFANVSNSGEVIHLVFVVDDLREIEISKTVGRFPLGNNAEKNIADRINRCISGIRNSERHNVGLTLIVNCGIGRNFDLVMPEMKAEDWQVDSCSLEDLVHMSRLIDFDPFDLIRISRGVTKATELGVRIDNPHGIANLIAWVRSNKGHVVPSNRLPQECRINEFTIGIAPSYIRELRAESSQINDIVSVPNI